MSRTVLTEKQKEVARGLLEGKTYREIAESIGVSYETVRDRVESLRRLSGHRVKSRLVLWLSRNPRLVKENK